MIGRILLWFYCLPMGQAAALMLLAAGAAWLARRQWGEKGWFVPVSAALTVLWLAAVAAVTLLRRDPTEVCTVNLMPLHSYREVLAGGNIEILRSNFMNTALFFPGGVLLGLLLPRKWRAGWRMLTVLAVFAVLSVGIELLQYRFHLGRVEADDVLHNALGGLLGAGVLSVRDFTDERHP